MKDVFWHIFRETGEPMCYLLSRADTGLYDLPGETRFTADPAVKTEVENMARAESGENPSAAV